jgi:hypothetical protein
MASKQIHITKLHQLIDYPSGNQNSIFSKVHIHVYHGGEVFSKSNFKDGKYDNMTVLDADRFKIKYYCLRMALESKRLTEEKLVERLKTEIDKKN